MPPTTSHHAEQVQQHNQRNLVEPLFHLIVCCFLLISKLNSPSSSLIFLLSSTSSSFVYSSRMILINTLKLKSKNCLQSQTQQDQLLEEFGKISSPKISGSDKHVSYVFDRVPFLLISCPSVARIKIPFNLSNLSSLMGHPILFFLLSNNLLHIQVYFF